MAQFIPVILGVALGAQMGLMGLSQSFAATDMARNPAEITIRLQVGWNATFEDHDEDNEPLGGQIPDMILYDEKGEVIGMGRPVGKRNNIWEGEWQDLTIKPHNRFHRAEYLQLNANRKDDICISSITVSQPNGVQVMITGDIPSGVCGYHGYPESLTKIQTTTQGDLRPHCFWMIGTEASNQTYPQSIVFHLEDFVGHGNHTAAYNSDSNAICDVQPRMWKYDTWAQIFPVFWPPLIYPPANAPEIPATLPKELEWNYLDVNYLQDMNNWRNKSDRWPWKWKEHHRRSRSVDLNAHQGTADSKTARQKRDPATPRTKRYYRKGVQHDAIHGRSVSARYACEKQHMRGPDILSHAEKLYCDLDTNTLYPLCEKNRDNTAACFDADAMELVGAAAEEESNHNHNQPRTWREWWIGPALSRRRTAGSRQVMKKIVSPLDVDETD